MTKANLADYYIEQMRADLEAKKRERQTVTDHRKPAPTDPTTEATAPEETR